MPDAISPQARRRSLPPGGLADIWTARDGWRVRTLCWPHPDGGTPCRGSLLFAAGRADFIEKYAECLWEWRDWGLAVAAFDWRGQGGSGRLGDAPHKGHATRFEPWLEDFDGIAGWFRSALPGPHFVVGHSMGGHLVLRWLAGGGTGIDRAVLVAPMLALPFPPMLRPLVPRLAGLACRLGWAGRWAPGQGPAETPLGDAALGDPARQRALTSDRDRYADELWWVATRPELALGGVTYGWLREAFRSMARLEEPGMLESVRTPLLLLMPEADRVVDLPAVLAAARRLPDARYVGFPGAAHELLRERDPIRGPAQAAMRDFLLGLRAASAR